MYKEENETSTILKYLNYKRYHILLLFSQVLILSHFVISIIRKIRKENPKTVAQSFNPKGVTLKILSQ
ncbi:MAG: hypothetical protein A3K25_03830 [Planctomycetes bacterium RIFOXYB12_FULL_42_10]|nr:MAG: hypothetical protein A3K25_03830 [Planctomycetes bacterium RIFOXYB12_FULL_42_10]